MTRLTRSLVLLSAMLALAGPAAAIDGRSLPGPGASLAEAAAPDARALFDQAMALYWDGDCAAARALFAEALEADRDCAICAWGEALALGPRIGAAMAPADQGPAYELALLARETAGTPRDLALAGAMVYRYQAPGGWVIFSRYMERLAAQYPQEPNLQLVAAEAILILAERDDDGGDRSDLGAAAALIERAARAAPEDPAVAAMQRNLERIAAARS
ncbi:hypothetical protein [Poseidonocella sp. HB161398]|uniref:hypothetical protein n=1 Tax=Poseidonocella sp. HB161398 TaxID=2320855 RepID=UPI0011082401|nr:hypothetical protein [Poseidonocella sp. HB161398]